MKDLEQTQKKYVCQHKFRHLNNYIGLLHKVCITNYQIATGLLPLLNRTFRNLGSIRNLNFPRICKVRIYWNTEMAMFTSTLPLLDVDNFRRAQLERRAVIRGSLKNCWIWITGS
jgi:hypothetical protein